MANAEAQFFKNKFGIPSGPADSEDLRPRRVKKTVSGVNSMFGISTDVFEEITGLFPSSFVKTDEKQLLKVFEITNDSRVRVPSGRATSETPDLACIFLLTYL